MASTALDIREILAIVLRFADPKTLQAAAQVNSLWANEATNILWRGKYRHELPPMMSLLQNIVCLKEDRRDWYTSKIWHLELGYSDNYLTSEVITHSLKSKLFKFPALRSVIVDMGSENMEGDDMVQFLSPKLISLEFYGGYYASNFLDAIKKYSPGLKFFLIDNAVDEDNHAHPRIDLECLISFLDDMPSIVHLELERGYQDWNMKPFLRYLIRRPNLEFLSLGLANEVQGHLVKEIISDTVELDGGKIFPALRFLNIYAQETAMASMIPFLGGLQGIRLYLDSQNLQQQSGILSLLSRCSHLEDVYLESTDLNCVITSADLLTLASGCAKMRRLEIDEGCTTDSHFNDRLIDKLACRWKNLAVLSLPFEVELTGKSLVSLARNCTNLHELKIESDFSLIEVGRFSKPIEVFPRLQVLQMSQIDLHVESEDELPIILKSTREYFDKWFPALRGISFAFDNENSTAYKVSRHLQRILSETRPPMSYPAVFPATSVSYELLQKLLEPDSSSPYNSAF